MSNFCKGITCSLMVWFCAGAYAETIVFHGESVTIPELGPAAPSIIEVPVLEQEVVKISIKLYGLSHTYDADEIFVALSNPQGLTTVLINNAECDIEYGVDVAFADDGEPDFRRGCRSGFPAAAYLPGVIGDYPYELTLPIAPLPPYFDTFAPLIEADVSGRWMLWAEDFVDGDDGRIERWELIFETAGD